MSLKLGNFSFRARTAQNWLRMGKYGTYLEFNRSQEAPKHCPTFDSLTQSCARAHFRLPPVCPRFAPSLPPVCPQFDWHCISVTDFFQTVNPYFWNNSLGYHQWGQLGGYLGATWGLPGGYLKWAQAQHWMSQSKVGQCLGASWDLLNSRYVPYFPIRSWFWAVRACK